MNPYFPPSPSSLSKAFPSTSLSPDFEPLSSITEEEAREMGSNSRESDEEVQGEIENLLRELRNGQSGTGSYACGLGVRRIQEKKEGMERLFQLLETRVQALERAERLVKTQLFSIKQRESALKSTPHPTENNTTRSLLELQRTAELLEAKTRALIAKNKALDSRVTPKQSKDLDLRFLELLNEEETLSERRGALEARDIEVQKGWEGLKQAGNRWDRLERDSAVRESVAEVLGNVFIQAAERKVHSADLQKQAVAELFTQLAREAGEMRRTKSSLHAQATSLLALQASLQTAHSELATSLALAKQGQMEVLLSRRDEVVHRKEALFNEKLSRLQERERLLRDREQDLVLREAKLLAKEGFQAHTPIANDSEQVLKQRQKELKALETALKARAKVLEEQESRLKQAVLSLETQKNQVKSAWEAAQLRLDQAHNLELRLEATKREIERNQSEEIEKSPRKTGEKELKDGKEVKKMRAEIRKKAEDLRISEGKRVAAEQETALLSQQIQWLRTQSSPATEDFQQSFLLRQQSMLRTLDQATQEKREMAQTLRSFLSELH